MRHGVEKSASLLLALPRGLCDGVAFHFVLLQWHLTTLYYSLLIPSLPGVQPLTRIVLEIVVRHYRFSALVIRYVFKSYVSSTLFL